jgi:hypothetical protein
MEVQTNPLIVP